MMRKNSNKEVIIGAALGTLVGSLGAVLLPKQKVILKKMKDQVAEWFDQAKGAGESTYNKVKGLRIATKDTENHNFAIGACVGVLLGAGSALFLAPKSGKQLRKDLTQTYQDVTEKTIELIDFLNFQNATQNNAHKAHPRTVQKAIHRTTTKTSPRRPTHSAHVLVKKSKKS